MYRRAIVALAAASSLLVAGCGGGQNGADPAPSAGAGQAQQTDSYPVQIENCGRTLTFNEAPSRVVTGYQPVLEVMVGLGLADKVVGRTSFDGSLLPDQASAIERIPIVSNNPYLPSKEELLTLQPDFVYSTGYTDFEAASGRATLEELNAVGIPAYIGGGACSAQEAGTATLQDTYTDIMNIGTIFGVTDRALSVVERMKATVSEVRGKVEGKPVVPVIFYSSGTGPLRLGGSGLNTEIIDLAGGTNIFADQEVYFEASREAVAGAGADAFVISDYQPGPTAEQKAAFLSSAFPTMAAGWDRDWPTIDAVYTHPGWRHADAVARLANQLHPDAFG